MTKPQDDLVVATQLSIKPSLWAQVREYFVIVLLLVVYLVMVVGGFYAGQGILGRFGYYPSTMAYAAGWYGIGFATVFLRYGFGLFVGVDGWREGLERVGNTIAATALGPLAYLVVFG